MYNPSPDNGVTCCAVLRKLFSDFVFDPNSYIYMANACCELLHYRVAAYVVGGLEVVLLIGWGIFSLIFYNAIGMESIRAYLAITGQSLIALFAIACIRLVNFLSYTVVTTTLYKPRGREFGMCGRLKSEAFSRACTRYMEMSEIKK